MLIGSSRVELGLRAKNIEGWLDAHSASPPIVHNLGLSGAGPLIEWTVVRRLLLADQPPDGLVIEINPMFCSAIDGISYDMQRVLNLEKLIDDERTELRRLGWNWTSGELVRALTPAWFRDRSAALARIGVHPSRSVDSEPWTNGRDAWGDWTMVLEDRGAVHRHKKTLAAKRDYYERLQTLEINPVTHRLYDDMLARCRARNVAVTLLLMPEADRFRE